MNWEMMTAISTSATAFGTFITAFVMWWTSLHLEDKTQYKNKLKELKPYCLLILFIIFLVGIIIFLVKHGYVNSAILDKIMLSSS